jgi:phage repressor protein C with HTH and peptisase S24 domain
MNPWVILGFVLAVGAAAGGGYYKGNSAGRAEVQQAWDKEKAEQYAEYAKGQEQARKREQELQANADKLRKEKDAEIKNINARATALANSLQQRQTRPTETSTVPSVAGTGPTACTGKELYREDGEFLVRLSREADELAAALNQCYKQYNAARQK